MLSEVVACNCVRNPGGHAESNSRPSEEGVSVLGAWSMRCLGWADWIDCRCFLSCVFLGDARRLELSPCNTHRTVASKQANEPASWQTHGQTGSGHSTTTYIYIDAPAPVFHMSDPVRWGAVAGSRLGLARCRICSLSPFIAAEICKTG